MAEVLSESGKVTKTLHASVYAVSMQNFHWLIIAYDISDITIGQDHLHLVWEFATIGQGIPPKTIDLDSFYSSQSSKRLWKSLNGIAVSRVKLLCPAVQIPAPFWNLLTLCGKEVIFLAVIVVINLTAMSTVSVILAVDELLTERQRSGIGKKQGEQTRSYQQLSRYNM